MKFAAGVLTLVLVPSAALRPPAVPPATPAPAPLPAAASSQEWLAEPVLPAVFQIHATDAAPDLDGLFHYLHADLSAEMPPLSSLATFLQEPPARSDRETTDEKFPRGIDGVFIQAWRDEDDLRRIRAWVGEATLGVPLLFPQLILEEFLPRGVAVGPTTFFYRTAPASSSLAFVVFDQVLFHEAQFLAQAQAYAEDGYYENLERGQRRVLRRSLMTGFRATYAMPKASLDLIVQSAEDQGVWGYVLAPPIAGALLYLKGVDQKVEIGDDIRMRFKLASGRDCLRGTRSEDGDPALSFELKFCGLPVGILASFDLSDRGVLPAFVGIGTSLDVVEEVLSREEAATKPYGSR